MWWRRMMMSLVGLSCKKKKKRARRYCVFVCRHFRWCPWLHLSPFVDAFKRIIIMYIFTWIYI